MKSKLKFTLITWLVVTTLTIGLCFITNLFAELFNIDIPKQANIETVRQLGVYTWDAIVNDGVINALGDRNVLSFLLNLVIALIIAPVFEEFIFRYLLWKLPNPRRMWIGAMFSSILFSAAHYIAQPFPDNAIFALFFFGMAQCWLYHKTDRIWCPMLNHCLFNLANVVLLFAFPNMA